MKQSSVFVWRNARINMGLPDNPDDLNEAQYAKIMFDTLCDVSRISFLMLIETQHPTVLFEKKWIGYRMVKLHSNLQEMPD